MTRPVYLDTSALVRRAETFLPSPSDRDLHAGTPVAHLIRSGRVAVSTSVVALLEFHDVVTLMWRDTHPTRSAHDQGWVDRATTVIMADMASERLHILSIAPRAYEQAMTLVTMAAREYARKFRVWDALHLVAATTWASTLGAQVELWTTDDDFAGFLSLYPHFASAVAVRDLDD